MRYEEFRRTVDVPQWVLKKAGLWEDVVRRFGVTDDVKVVRIPVGTLLKRNGERVRWW